MIDDNIEAADRLLRYALGKKNADGLFSWGLPDWCETLSKAENMSSTPLEVSDTLTAIETYGRFAVLCDIAGRAALSEFWLEEAERLRELFRKKYLIENSLISCRTQTAQARAIAVGVFREAEKEAAFRALLALIREIGYFKVGVSGARTLFRLLCDNGEQNLALKLMTQSGAPSFRWWIDQGLTTLGESINETYPGSALRKDGSRMLSLNHFPREILVALSVPRKQYLHASIGLRRHINRRNCLRFCEEELCNKSTDSLFFRSTMPRSNPCACRGQ